MQNGTINPKRLTISVRTKPETVTRLRYYLADKRGETMSSFVEQAIEEKLDREERKR